MPDTLRKLLATLAAIPCLAAVPFLAVAQPYPAKPVVVIENKGGAGGSVGAESDKLGRVIRPNNIAAE